MQSCESSRFKLCGVAAPESAERRRDRRAGAGSGGKIGVNAACEPFFDRQIGRIFFLLRNRGQTASLSTRVSAVPDLISSLGTLSIRC